MELKHLSSNWKKLQATIQQNKENVIQRSTIDGHEKPHGAKRKRVAESTLHSQKVGYPEVKKRRSGAKMGSVQSGQHASPTSQNATSRFQSVNQSAKPSFAADRINEGLSPTCVLPHVSHHFRMSTDGNYSAEIGKYVAVDCEMVGVGPNPDRESSLARVSAVNFHGDQIYDSYVKQKEEVTDWRTHVSGILPKHMVEARTLEQVQAEISALLNGNVLVGHAIRNDLDALKLGHPRRDIRDTARHPPFRKLAGGGSPKLKILASELLGIDIQGGEHSSVEDARACMLLFRREKEAFEREHSKKWPTQNKADPVNGTDGGEKKKSKGKKKKKRK